jgi:hypothetical protein
MADQRFKPGDRVVCTGPSMFDVEQGSTYVVNYVEAYGSIHLRGSFGPSYGYDPTLFRLACDQHPWASDLRKWKLVELVDRHPFSTNDYGTLHAYTVDYVGIRRRLLKANLACELARYHWSRS